MLNKPAYRKAQILVAGDNFGCGSSREHAPWALLDFGIRCVISTSFADIFYNNCFKNGILPITVSPEDLEKLIDDASRGSNATLTVDLEAKEIRGPDGGSVKFDLDDFKRHCLLNGLDDIGLTLEKAAAIDAFEKNAETAPGPERRPGSVMPDAGGVMRRLISPDRPSRRRPAIRARWSTSRLLLRRRHHRLRLCDHDHAGGRRGPGAQLLDDASARRSPMAASSRRRGARALLRHRPAHTCTASIRSSARPSATSRPPRR